MGLLRHAYRVGQSLLREHEKRVTRSPKWRAVEHAFLKVMPCCAACGSDVRLQVHHKAPFHLHPELELDPANLITLCMGRDDCHLLLGHGDDFKSWNPEVVQDAKESLEFSDRRQLIAERAKRNRKE